MDLFHVVTMLPAQTLMVVLSVTVKRGFWVMDLIAQVNTMWWNSYPFLEIRCVPNMFSKR